MLRSRRCFGRGVLSLWGQRRSGTLGLGDRRRRGRLGLWDLSPEQIAALPVPPKTEVVKTAPQGAVRDYPPLETGRRCGAALIASRST